MKNRKSGILLTALAVMMAFSSMLYISCNKDEGSSITGEISCLEVLCLNGGTCVDGECMCPTGYYGDSCQLSWSSRYIGSYTVTETITWSSNATLIGNDSIYNARISQSSVPQIFFIDSLVGNPKFNSVTGIVDSTTENFMFQANEAIFYNNLIIQGGKGSINDSSDKLTGVYARQLKDSMGNTRTDSVVFSMLKK